MWRVPVELVVVLTAVFACLYVPSSFTLRHLHRFLIDPTPNMCFGITMTVSHAAFLCSVGLTLWVVNGSSNVFQHWRGSSALCERCIARKAARVSGVCCLNGFQGQWYLNVCFTAAAVSCAPCDSRQFWVLWSHAQSEMMHFISSSI